MLAKYAYWKHAELRALAQVSEIPHVGVDVTAVASLSGAALPHQ